MHRRYRQIARLIYHYCCVRYMTRDYGRWVEDTALCPVCDGDGEFMTMDDLYVCSECGGKGFVPMKRYKEWCEEMKK